MKDSDQPRFAKLLWELGETYSKEITPILSQIYWELLREYECEDIDKAFRAHVLDPDKGQFFPKPADIIYALRQGFETYALFAWHKVETAVARVGVYESIVFDDPRIHVILEKQGGWIYLCGLDHYRMAQYAYHFLKEYLRLWPQVPASYPAYLKGVLELSNSRQQLPFPEPRLIGDPIQAQHVLKHGTEEGRKSSLHQPAWTLLINSELGIKEKEGKEE